jgi:hypothetical protein
MKELFGISITILDSLHRHLLKNSKDSLFLVNIDSLVRVGLLIQPLNLLQIQPKINT